MDREVCKADSLSISLSTVATAPLGPPYDPLAEWVANTSRRDNPIMDSLFDFGPVENPTGNEPSHHKSTQKKTTQKKSTQKQPAQNKSDQGEPAQKKPKTM